VIELIIIEKFRKFAYSKIKKKEMSSYIPRYGPAKKEGQLEQKREELEFAITRGYSTQKLEKATEKYRAAMLSYFKAKIHVIRENELQKKPHNMNIEKIENDVVIWTNKTIEEIINEIKAKV
jgi:hypothetical protein